MVIAQNGGTPPPDFNDEFASPADYAAHYRAHGLQVVPAWMPGEPKDKGSWKRPFLKRWVDYQDHLVDDPTFKDWYDPLTGEHRERPNLGVITGVSNIFVIDLDTQRDRQAWDWWQERLAIHNNRLDLDTARQRTGGGGLQLLFRAPPGVEIPTCKTSIGVDIRGHGGFAMLPPSLHESKKHYEWEPGRTLGDCGIMFAPDWLIEEVKKLASEHSTGGSGRPGGAGPSRRGIVRDAFNKVVDGREEYMRDLVRAALIGFRVIGPVGPPLLGSKDVEAVWADYLRNVEMKEPLPGESLEDNLERKGRGRTVFETKWRADSEHWFGDVTRAADERVAKQGPAAPDPAPAPAVDPKTGQPLPLVLSAAQFIAGYLPPYYVIDGIVQRGYLYSLTARTNHGKTALVLFFAQCVARGQAMHGCETTGGTVLFLAGENSQDIRARFLVLAETYDFDPEAIKVKFIDGVIPITKRMSEIIAAAEQIDDLVLVIVDTAAAYFTGDDVNNNSQQGAYARELRGLTKLRGNPAVLVNCHPVKNAARDNLLPMGGSAFLNEVDGNLTLWANDEKQTSLHWLGKFRGPEFDSMAFELVTGHSERAVDAKGRMLPSVVAKPISETVLEAGERRQEADENRVLRAIHESPRATENYLANRCGFATDGRPNKSKVHRIIKRLIADKLLVKRRRQYSLTANGKKEIGLGDD